MSYVPDLQSDVVHSLAHGKTVSCVHPMSNTLKVKERMIQSNKYKQAFTSLQFGSSQIALNIPLSSVINGVWINMTFQGINVADAIAPLAGYASIAQVQYRFGNSTLYSISGPDMFQIVRSTLNTSDQVNELIDVAGGATSTVIGAGSKQVAVWLHMPFSRLNSGGQLRYGIDTGVMNAPLTILIDLAAVSKVFTVNVGGVTSLSSAFFHIAGCDYLDKSQKIMPKPEEYFAFPCHYYQSFQCPSITPLSVTQSLSSTLTSFRKGNLLAIYFYASLDSDFGGTNPFKLVQINNLRVLFNGVVLYQSDNDPDIRIYNLTQNLMPASYSAYSQSNKTCEVILANVAPRYKNYSNIACLNLANQILNVEYSLNTTSAASLHAIYVYDAAVVYNATSSELVL